MTVIFTILRLLMHHHKSMIKLRSSARIEVYLTASIQLEGSSFLPFGPCSSCADWKTEHKNELMDRVPILTLLLCKLSYNEIHKSP